MKMKLLLSLLSLIVYACAATSNSVSAATYGVCKGYKYKPQTMLILTRESGRKCFRQLKEAGTWRVDRNDKNVYEINPGRDVRKGRGYLLAYVTSANESKDIDRVLSIKERHGPINILSVGDDVRFTEEVILKRKGEDYITRRGRSIRGIRTLCGQRFFRDIKALIARDGEYASVSLNEYNTYHTTTGIARGDLSFFHIKFQNEKGKCVFTADVKGGKASRIRKSFAFRELGIAKPNGQGPIVRLFKPFFGGGGTALASNDRYTTLVSHISKSYERNGYLISEFYTDLARDTRASLTVRHLYSGGTIHRRFPTTYWQLSYSR